MIGLLSRWMKDKQLIFTADSSYSALELLSAVKDKAVLITRLRLDAALYAAVPQRKAGQAGRKRLKEERLPTLKERLTGPGLDWQSVLVPQWYGQKDKKMQLTSGTALWYHSGMEPVPICWVLLKDTAGKGGPAALLSTDLSMDAIAIVNYFIRRWTVEVTFKEVRTHLGVETQRQWDMAIARTTPVLMGLFSITTIWANELYIKGKLLTENTAWYQKNCPPLQMHWQPYEGSFGHNTLFAHLHKMNRHRKYPVNGSASLSIHWPEQPDLAKVQLSI